MCMYVYVCIMYMCKVLCIVIQNPKLSELWSEKSQISIQERYSKKISVGVVDCHYLRGLEHSHKFGSLFPILSDMLMRWCKYPHPIGKNHQN